MKNSGVEWIGEIPYEWEIKRLKAVLKERNNSNNPIQTNYILSLTNDRGVIPYDEKGDVGNKSKEDVSGYKLAYPNDIVLNSMNVIIGSVALSKYYGCVSPVYYMLYPRNAADDVRYYNYIFQTKEFQNKLKGYGNGIMEIRMRIQMSKLNTVELPVADSETQIRIADFLDEKCAKIDAVIEKQKHVIEKLKEYKLSVITEAVTKGLDPTVPMKDSGVEWIGEIPECWDVTTVARVATVVRGASPRPAGDPKYFNGSDVPWITVAEVTKDDGKYICSTETFLTKEGALYSRLVEKGTLLLSNSGATLGVPKVTKINGCINDGSVAFYDLKLEQFYLFYLFKARTFELRKQMQGYGQPNLNTSIIKTIQLPLPTREAQLEIINYLDRKSIEIDTAISKKQAIVEKLTEYKKSLIYEVVTGKREV